MTPRINVHTNYENQLGRSEEDCQSSEACFDFEDVYFFDWKNAVITTSHGGRFKAIGYYEDGTSVVVYALLGSEAISIISFRPASNKERKVLP